MRNRRANLTCVLGLSLLATGCYNNPDVSARRPGSATHMLHSGPQVGPGTTAGGSTAGPQPVAVKGHSEVNPTPGGATHAPSDAGHAGAATPEAQHGTSTPSGTQSRTGNEKGVGQRTESTPEAKH